MILTIPTIFLIDGKSKFSIGGLSEFSKLDSFFKNNPFELAKLFREENNKSILVSIDNSKNSISILGNIIDKLDIPIQLILPNILDKQLIESINDLKISRIFTNQKISLKNIIPVIKYSEFDETKHSKKERILIDMESQSLVPIKLLSNLKISIINSLNTTKNLIELNTSNSNVDSVYLGKDYYGIQFAGQTLWRIAEKDQFSI